MANLCNVKPVSLHGAHTLQAAALKHIGFGPMKKENQDEFFIQARHTEAARNFCCCGASRPRLPALGPAHKAFAAWPP